MGSLCSGILSTVQPPKFAGDGRLVDLDAVLFPEARFANQIPVGSIAPTEYFAHSKPKVGDNDTTIDLRHSWGCRSRTRASTNCTLLGLRTSATGGGISHRRSSPFHGWANVCASFSVCEKL